MGDLKTKRTVYLYIQYADNSAYYEFLPDLIVGSVLNLGEVKNAICKHESDYSKIYYNHSDVECVDAININSCLMASLIESKLNIKYFQCVKKCANALYFYAKVTNRIEDDKLLKYKWFKSDNNRAVGKFRKYINRKNKRLQKNIKKSADEVARYSFKLDRRNIIYLILSVVLALAGIAVAVFVDGKAFFSAFCALIVFPIAKFIYDVVCRYRYFKNNCNVVRLSDVSEGTKSCIINSIKDYCRKNCTDIAFSDETYDLNGKEIFIYSQKENCALCKIGDDVVFTVNNHKRYVTAQSKKALAAVVEQKRLQGKYLFNGKLLGVESDLNFVKGVDIIFKNVDYYSYISCDELIFKKITDADAPEFHFNGSIACIDKETGMLRNYHKSPLTNLIGINLIVEISVINCERAEKNSYYIINRQSSYNDANGCKFVPSSSGSLERVDAKQIKSTRDSEKVYGFKKTFTCGMLRELREESCLELSADESEIEFLGYSKLMSKGGKPDFFALLRLDVKDKSEILKTFNIRQNKRLGEKKPLESDFMLLVEKNYFLSDAIKTDNFSPQLKYMRFLLRESGIKN
ncbi:MAG: hypothetical protein NC033_06315 [Clostridiales bacterium]|nr:hypothetical protein [Clostridiales bacterium]